MTTQSPNPNLNEQEAFIPPFYMLILAAIAFLIAIVVALTQANFGVVGWGALGLGALSLVVWVFMAPDQFRSLLTGRTARYGGTTVIVTVLFLLALIAIYSMVKSRNLRADLTQRDDFSLNEQTRTVIAGLAVEPNVPNIRILAFYGTNDASQKDQASILFDDYAKTSQGKISYEFIDPDRSPGLAQQYKIVSATSSASKFAVAPLDASGQPIPDKSQTVQFLSQENLTNAIMRVAASGDFRAYFLDAGDTLKLADTGATGMSQLNGVLTDSFNWKTQDVNMIDLTAPESTIKLNDAAADGEVLIIAGGTSALPDDQAKFITDYLDKGGKLVIFPAPLNADGKPTLASADNLNTYLYDKFGIRFANDVVLDKVQAVSGEPYFVAALGTDMDKDQYITKDFFGSPNTFMIFKIARSIDVAPTAPTDVTVSQLVKSGADSYSKTDPTVLTATEMSQFDPVESDAKGPFVMAAAAENTKTGAKVVLMGSLDVPSNQYATLTQQGVANLNITLTSLSWTTKFEDFFTKIPQLAAQQRPQDAPVVVTPDVGRNINFITIILLPFGVLLIGILVWWFSREKRQA